MPGSNGAEMSPVERRHLVHVQPLGHRENRSIDGSEREIGVPSYELRHPSKINTGELDQLDFPIRDRVQEPGFGCGTNARLQEVADLRENRTRHEQRTSMPFEQIQATLMVSIVLVEDGNERTCVAYDHGACLPRSSRSRSSDRAARSGSARISPANESRRRRSPPGSAADSRSEASVTTSCSATARNARAWSGVSRSTKRCRSS